MRFQFDAEKNCEVLQKHRVSLEAAQEIFDQAHLVDRKNDNPEQFRAIGWTGGRLCSVIFEIRRDCGEEFYHLIAAWCNGPRYFPRSVPHSRPGQITLFSP